MAQSTSTVGVFVFPDKKPFSKERLAALVLAHEAQDPNLVKSASGSVELIKKFDEIAQVSPIEGGLLVWLHSSTWKVGCGQSLEWRIRSALATFLSSNPENITFLELA